MAPASSGAGYSGTPLGKKLSLKPGLRVWFDDGTNGIVHQPVTGVEGGDITDVTEPQVG